MEKERTSIVINAFGGAGAGKTTACLEIVEKLKKKGYLAEYIQEYAKELVYDLNSKNPAEVEFAKKMLDGSMESQEKIFEEQKRRIDRTMGQVDFIVSDSPLLLSYIYYISFEIFNKLFFYFYLTFCCFILFLFLFSEFLLCCCFCLFSDLVLLVLFLSFVCIWGSSIWLLS